MTDVEMEIERLIGIIGECQLYLATAPMRNCFGWGAKEWGEARASEMRTRATLGEAENRLQGIYAEQQRAKLAEGSLLDPPDGD